MRYKRKPDSLIKQLKEQADTMLLSIFRYQPCYVCKTVKFSGFKSTVRHHLIKQSQDGRLKYNIWNIIPLCTSHHQGNDEIAAHGSISAMEAFDEWFKTYLTLHYNWMCENRNAPARKIDIDDMEEIIADLQTIINNNTAEKIIYETS